MNDNEAVIAELRKISAWADMQRKVTRWSLIVVAVAVPVLVVLGVVLEQLLKTKIDSLVPVEQSSWYDVDEKIRGGNFEDAIRMGEELIAKTPQYPEAHRRLAGAYLAAGKVEQARKHYAELFRLFPSEEYQKLLNAIEKRSQADNAQPVPSDK
jgi:thioredoxin-like negative regulator of GroEL